ncbi:hypothetical protein [Variovorax sp. EL159]|uniref:hypothetical protein n=1 Tax=Variovorax sp. EL159 TaxID=1566270 RepID=UPI001C40A5D0|nr:hypothetical protein [Variovorax sp. EL159]
MAEILTEPPALSIAAMKSLVFRLNTGVRSLVDVPVGNLETHFRPLNSSREFALAVDAGAGPA